MFHSNCDGSDAITTVPPSMPIIAANSLAFRDEARLRDVWKRRIAVIDAMMPSACPMPMSSRPRTRIQKPPPLANVLEKVSRHSRPVRDVTRAFMVQRLPMTQAQTVRLDVDGALARMTFNRPEVLNAGNARFAAELGEVVDALAAHRDVRVVVMTGAGRAFQTGVDLTALAAGELGIDDLVRWEDAMTAIERMDKLFIAGINGHCIGGGLQLALVCDYRLAVEDALLSLPAVKECLIPSMALFRLPRLIGLEERHRRD